MKKNANYTWVICQECKIQTKILPGQVFNNKEEWLKIFKCNCIEDIPKPIKRKVVKDEA